MDSYRNTGIKEILDEFPLVGDILEEYGIGCGPCTVGICRLKDVVEIHTLPPEKEQELMSRIEAVISPDREIPDRQAGEVSPLPKEHTFSSPMQILVDEHKLIKRWLALIPLLLDNIDITTDVGRQVIVDGIDLIRSYADRLHHGKEEDILFAYFDDSEKIFQVIYEDHRVARNHVEEMLGALEAGSFSLLRRHLTAYGRLLAEHIKKEDEILFPWLDRKLSGELVGELSRKFAEKDEQLQIDAEKYRTFVQRLERRFETAEKQAEEGAEYV